MIRLDPSIVIAGILSYLAIGVVYAASRWDWGPHYDAVRLLAWPILAPLDGLVRLVQWLRNLKDDMRLTR